MTILFQTSFFFINLIVAFVNYGKGDIKWAMLNCFFAGVCFTIALVYAFDSRKREYDLQKLKRILK